MTEIGRSMVEMLGTLTIMALLGIGAIKIYHNFINKTKIQNTAKEIQTLVLERQNSAISLTTGGRRHVEAAHCDLYLENGTDGKFANYFWIDTTLNNEDFCSGLKKSDLINAKVIEGVCPGKLTFYFKKSPNLFVEDGIYVDTNGNKHFCPEHVIACDDENTATACEDGYYVNDASCLPCPEPTCTIICSEEEVYNPSFNACVPICHQNSDCGECEHCGESGFCEGCPTGETCAKKFEDPLSTKSCYPDEDLVDNVYCEHPDGNGNCCDSKGENCCPPDKPLMTIDGVCRSCDDTTYNDVVNKTINLSANCNRCPNRELRRSWYINQYCVVKNCPEETPLQNYKGQCLPCDAAIQFMCDPDTGYGYNNSCSLCPNRGEAGYKYGHGYECVICPGESRAGSDGRCTCPPEKPLLGKDGCHSCDENVPISTFNQEGGRACSVCPNRTEFWNCCRGTVYCGLTICEENQIHDVYGVCRDCSQSADIRMNNPNGKTHFSPDTCSSCSGRYTNTDSNNNVTCKKCPAIGTNAWNNLNETQKAECNQTGS